MCIIQFLKIPFVQDLLATIIGAFLGALSGFLLALKKDRKTQMVHMQKRRNALLQGVQNTLESNQKYVQSIRKAIRELTSVPFFNVDPLFLEQTEPLMYELEFDAPLLSSLLALRWNLRQLYKLVEILQAKSIKETDFKALSNDQIYKRTAHLIVDEDDTLERISDALALVKEQINNAP